MTNFSNKDLVKESRSVLLVSLGYNIDTHDGPMWEKGDIYCIKGMQAGPLYSYFEGHDDVITYPMGYTIKHKDLLKELILVEAEDSYSIASTTDGLYIQKKDGKINAYTKNIGGGFSNVIDRSEASSENDMEKYKILFPLEGSRALFVKDDLDMSILDKAVFSGMLSRSKREMSYPELFKFIARLKQKLAPATKLSKANIAIALESFPHKDGGAEESAQYVQKCLEILGTYASLDSIKGNLKQGRLGSGKFAAYLQDKRTIMKNVLFHDPNPIVVSDNEATKLIADYFNGTLAEEMKGRVIVTGEGDIDLFVDMNCIKSPMDFSDRYLWALDSSKTNQRTASTSMQALYDIIGIEGGKELIRKRILELVNQKMDEVENASKAKHPRFSDKTAFYAVGMIREICPDIAIEDKAILTNMLSDALFSLSSIIDRFNDIVDGAFGRAVPDPAVEYGYSILAINECLSVDAESRGADKVWSIRNPKTTANDSAVQIVVYRKEFCERVDKLDAPSSIKKSIKSKVMCLKKGVIVFNPSKRFVGLYGTADWDFDGYTKIFNKKYIELKLKGKSVIPNIILKSSPDDGRRYHFDCESARKVWKNEVSSLNEVLGVVCNWQHTLLALLDDLPTARKVFIAAFGGGGLKEYCKLKYVEGEDGYFSVDISEEVIHKVFESYKYIDFSSISDASMKRILMDTIHIYVSYIQRTVDSKKTSDLIYILFKVGHYAKAMSLLKMSLKLNKENKLEFTQSGADVGKKVVLFEDFFYKVKKEAFELLKVRAEKVLSKISDTKDEDLRLMSESYSKYVTRSSLGYSIDQLSFIYKEVDSLTRNTISKMEKSLENEYGSRVERTSREMISLIKSEKKEMLSYLYSMLYKLIPNASLWEMGAIAKKLSRNDSKDTYSKFALSVTPREYVAYSIKSSETRGLEHADSFISTLSKVSKKKAEKLRGIKELEFCNGVSDLDIKSKDDLNGLYEIKEINDRFYATRPIEKVLVEEALIDNNKIAAIIDLDSNSIDINGYDSLYLFCNQHVKHINRYKLRDVLVGKKGDEYYVVGRVHTPVGGNEIIEIYDRKQVELSYCISTKDRTIAFFDIVKEGVDIDKNLIKECSIANNTEYRF